MCDSDSGFTSFREREQQRKMLRFIEARLYKVFPGARPIVEGAAQVIGMGYRAYLILLLPLLVYLEIGFAYDLVQELKAVPIDNFQVFGDIVMLLMLGIIIVIVSRDALRVAMAIKYCIKK